MLSCVYVPINYYIVQTIQTIAETFEVVAVFPWIANVFLHIFYANKRMRKVLMQPWNFFHEFSQGALTEYCLSNNFYGMMLYLYIVWHMLL